MADETFLTPEVKKAWRDLRDIKQQSPLTFQVFAGLAKRDAALGNFMENYQQAVEADPETADEVDSGIWQLVDAGLVIDRHNDDGTFSLHLTSLGSRTAERFLTLEGELRAEA
jgi:hypothetical protein